MSKPWAKHPQQHQLQQQRFQSRPHLPHPDAPKRVPFSAGEEGEQQTEQPDQNIQGKKEY
jgi:hypothetical protein